MQKNFDLGLRLAGLAIAVSLRVKDTQEAQMEVPTEWMRSTGKLLDKAAAALLIKCQWSEDENGDWDTSCDEVFEFADAGPKENKFKCCPFCGGHLVAVKHPKRKAK